MTIWPPKVKKIRQNAPGSEKMWFNILKNESRRAAYRFFINSMIHQGELIPPKPLEVRATEHNVREFTSPNGHFSWLVEFLGGKIDEMHLKTPDSAEPYKDYIEGMFEQEYPEQYAALEEFFKENAPATVETEEEEDSPSAKKGLIRKIMGDWRTYMDNINSFITDNLGNVGLSIPTQRYERLLVADINTNIPYKEVRDRIYARYGPEPTDFPLATIRSIQAVYAKALQRRNRDIVWENFINFIAVFRGEYMQHIRQTAINLSITTEEAVERVTDEHMQTLARNIWRNNTNEVETLMTQLPNYN